MAVHKQYPPTQKEVQQARRRVLRESAGPHDLRDEAFRRTILSVPAGKVSTYGAIAAASGYPRLHRAVARLLRTDPVDRLPWHRIIGAAGDIRLHGDGSKEQRLRLQMEGVEFVGKRVDLSRFQHALRTWEL